MQMLFFRTIVLLLFALPSSSLADPIQELELPLHDRKRDQPFDQTQAFEHKVPVAGELIIHLRFSGGPIQIVAVDGTDLILSGTYTSEHWQPASFSVTEAEKGKFRIVYEPPYRFNSRPYQARLGRLVTYADLVEISKEDDAVEYFEAEGKVVVAGLLPVHGEVISMGSTVRVGRLSAKTGLTVGIPRPLFKALKINTDSSECGLSGFESFETRRLRDGFLLLHPSLADPESCPDELVREQLFDF